MSRRRILMLGAATLAAANTRSTFVFAQTSADVDRHGISAFGDLAYPADFKHFSYVNPDAPKGGLYSESVSSRTYNGSFQTFNSLNSFILKGEGVFGMDLTFATLMVRSGDEPDAMYGLAAKSVSVSADGLTYRFTLRPEATFHDGTPITAQDVVWTLTTLKEQGHPIIAQQLREMTGAQAPDVRTVVVTFAEKRARDVPLFVAGLPILSKAYYENKPFDQTTLDIPLGSGAYKVGRFDVGRFIEYTRVKDWWGAALPVAVGVNNFDTIRYEYYRDRDVGFEAFTAGAYLFREEFTSRTWATRYDFPAFKDGRVKRAVVPDDTPSGAQGWFINTRRDKFKDRRLREALIDAFDFEWTNKNIMYGSYERTQSVFENSDMKATGKPGDAELKLLEPYRATLPADVFEEAYVPPVTDASGQDRRWLRRASQALTDAGCVLKDGKRLLPNGQPLTIEFLSEEQSFQPHHAGFIKSLGTLGIEASFRLVDSVQYRARVDGFDFDITVQRFGFSSTPGDSLRTYFSSRAAAIKGSQNIAGIADPAIDGLIETIIAAKTREELTIACRALDRVIRSGRYWIPHWYKATHWIAYWDQYAWPKDNPRYFRAAPTTWWADASKAKTVPEQKG